MDKLKVLTAKRIHTMDQGRPQADAVAIADGKIVSVGSLSTMQPWLKRYDHEIDDSFADKIILPGFIETPMVESVPARRISAQLQIQIERSATLIPAYCSALL